METSSVGRSDAHAYRGYNTSLYTLLNSDAIQCIERAILCRMTGQMDAGRSLFENELRLFKDTPAIAIEHADLEIAAGRWGAAFRIVDATLTYLKENKRDLDRPENRLIALTRAMLGVRHKGDLVTALYEIERTQTWLKDVPVGSYTDVQSSCVRRYVMAYLLVRLSSNYVNPDVENIPAHDDSLPSPLLRAPWSGLRQLRRSLAERGMFNEANAVFRTELNRTPLTERQVVVDEFLSTTEHMSSRVGRDYIEADVRLQSATSHVLLQNLQHAFDELRKGLEAISRLCSHLEMTAHDNLPQMQLLRIQLLSFVQDPVDKLRQTEDLAHELQSVRSGKAGECLSTAANLARAFYEVTSQEDYQTRYFDLQRRVEQYDETVSEDLCDLILHRNDLITFTINNVVDRQKSLEWIDGFFEKYPSFDSPGEIASLYRMKASVLRRLRRLNEAVDSEKRASQLDKSGPSGSRKWMHLGQNTSSVNADGATDPFRDDLEDEHLDGPFFEPWKDVIGDGERCKERSITIVWDWLVGDGVNQRINSKDWEELMGFSTIELSTLDSNQGMAMAENLKESTIKKISSLMFPAAGDPDPQASRDWFGHICRWLGNPPKGESKRRLFSLLEIRNSRQLHFSGTQQWDQQITELEHLIELNRTLPQQVQDMFPHSRGAWLGALALARMAKLETISDLTSEKVFDALEEAEKSNDEALEEFQKRNYLEQIALHQRNGANICMLQILRLQQLRERASDLEKVAQCSSISTDCHEIPGQDDPSGDIQKIRNRGLERIEETDRIHTEIQLSDSWIDGASGVKGIDNRSSITTFYATTKTIQVAVNLLLAEPGGPSPQTVTQIWHWVQKYKARALSKTIGIRSVDPPTLVKDIMASSTARPVYEEMLRLQEEISKASKSMRFDLRRQMDAHQQLMKEHPLLRRVIDLREATPFTKSDIEALTSRVGGSLVLVDWFYLQPFLVDDVGSLYLFTARGDSEPTMDILTTKMEDVLAWQEQYLFPTNVRDFREENLHSRDAQAVFDSMLGGLVAPLTRHITRNELLVLCPTTALHRVPLHALTITTPNSQDPDDPTVDFLIHCNPVVYTHSHSLLRSCVAASDRASNSPDAINGLFLSGIPEAEATQHGDYRAGRKSIQELACKFNTAPMLDREGSKQRFLERVPKSRLLHLHTHCSWQSAKPLDHCVEFPRVDEPVEPGRRPVETLSAREVFDLRFLPGTHINMIACQGGLTRVDVGDEVMGLVPALLYSGVSSSVSTLWSIGDKVGASFSKHFFQAFLRQVRQHRDAQVTADSSDPRSDDPVYFVDVAKAMQSAIRKLNAIPKRRKEDGANESSSRSLYVRAAFVLHGFWKFPISKEDMERIQQQMKA